LPAGMGYPFFYHPSSLLMNNGDGTFRDVAAREGIEPPRDGRLLDKPIGGRPAARSSRCAATADFDGDGRLDLLVNNFNDRPYYYQNRFPAGNYIAFRLTGTNSNRDAIGALARLFCGGQQMVRQVQCAGGYLSQSSKTLHFGLGDRTRVDRVEIRWPNGSTQAIVEPQINRLHEVTEPTERRHSDEPPAALKIGD
ncbi:MAG TPA: CRTAC1 family protein, partial [Pirellulales bacterium]|nr:CRTAC1 family protein [Pirellulales bacterium]